MALESDTGKNQRKEGLGFWLAEEWEVESEIAGFNGEGGEN